MPCRVAVYADLLPASKILAAAFENDYLFGEFIHPLRHEHPEDVYLYHLRWLRESYYTKPSEHLIVSYSTHDDTGEEDKITGIAHWIRMYSKPPKSSLLSQAALKSMTMYNAIDEYLYPNRAENKRNSDAVLNSYPYYAHHWTGARADSWHLSFLGVDPAFMKRGYGRQLVAWGFDRGREENVSVSVISVPGQGKFYRACGYNIEVGTMNDGGEANPLVAAGLPAAPILFYDQETPSPGR